MKKVVLAVVVLLSLTIATVAFALDASPTRIAVNGDGNLLVTDYTYGSVLTVDPVTLDIIKEININGRPLGIAWADGFLYVGNSTTKQVEVYNTFGFEIYSLGFGYTQTNPLDIATAFGNAYVVDGDTKDVKVFSLDGFYQFSIDGLANPTAIAIDETNGLIFVSDYGDMKNRVYPSVQVFHTDGSVAFTIKSGEPNKFRFTMPQGMIVQNGKLYLVDCLTSEIHIFNSTNGMLLSKVKGSGIHSGVYGMKLPLDIVTDGTNLYVTNNLMGTVKVFTGGIQ